MSMKEIIKQMAHTIRFNIPDIIVGIVIGVMLAWLMN